DKTLLLVEMTASKDLPAGVAAELEGTVDWLQCKDICVPGGADLSARIPVEAAPRPAADAVRKQFDAARAQLPRSAGGLENVALHPFQSLDAIPSGTSAEVALVFEGLGDVDLKHADFFPRPSEELWLRDASFRSDGEHVAVVIPVDVDESVEAGAVPMLGAVVRIPRAGGGESWLLSFHIPVTVAEEGVTPRPVRAAVFTPGAGTFLADDSGAGNAAQASGGGLLRFLLLAFLGGIILNVMPCVLPVISLKILGFVSQAEEEPAKIARLGLVFAAGVITSFLVLAGAVIALQAAGEHIGWGFQFQNPVFVAALIVVVFVFSLSLLGVFEVGGISAIAGMGVAAGHHKEYADSFFHGILTTVLATPCTAPMLGAAIAFALAQPPAIILLIFTTVAIGLSLPYVLLSMNPGWLKYVPKPGVWMDTFKQAMGFLLLATMVWLLFVFGAQTGAAGLGWLLAFLLLCGFFAWMHGRFLNLSSTGRRVALVWIITLVGVVWGYKGFLHGTLFPPEGYAEAGAASLSPNVHVTKGGIRWEPFSVATLDEAVEGGRTVFIDFTADWCWTCKVNERTVLADGEVESALRDNNVLTLKGDWTRKDPEITEILQKHQRAGVPFYAVYPADRPEDVIVLPEIINRKLVLESLRQAGPSREGA
ncbi:thioredoxin family protein, partial [bacterium]|nr:thioredoxin family protein [bacterium]